MVIRELTAELNKRLLSLGLTRESAALEAMELACFACGVKRDRYFLFSEEKAEPKTDPEELILRRQRGEPLAYILGEWDFYGMTLKTDARALIPRDDSAAVLELFLSRLPRKGELRVLDLCTGSGCLGLGAATERKDLSVTLCDISGDALSLAKENIALLGLEKRVNAVFGNALSAPEFSPGSFDGIICNPPYLRKDELEPTFEPILALDGGEDGLDFYRNVSREWAFVLRGGAPLCFEVGYTQSREVAEILEKAGFSDIAVKKDLSGIERAVCGIKKP